MRRWTEVAHSRREFIALSSVAFACQWPLVARAQQQAKPARIGVLVSSSIETPEMRALRRGLQELGYVEGQTLAIEYRAAAGDFSRLPALARELVDLEVDLIVAGATPGARAARDATGYIPIVAIAMGDPVGDGLVASFARPGGNLTGTTFLGPGLVPKRLDLLKELLPKLSRIGVLWHRGAFSDLTTTAMLEEAVEWARLSDLHLQLVEVEGPRDFDRAFQQMVEQRAEALFQFPSVMLFSQRSRLVALTAAHRLPAMFNERQFVELGGLIAYGASISDLSWRAATYVDKILRGQKPSDLPIEQPTKLELSINLQTATALNIIVPVPLLVRADNIIQ